MKRTFIGVVVILCSMIMPARVFSAHGFSAEMLLEETEPSNVSDPRICTGPDNAVYVVWSDKDEKGVTTVYFKKSINSGMSFEETRVIAKNAAPEIYLTDPEIGLDSEKKLFIVYSKYDYQNSKFSLLLCKSENNGDSFDSQTIFTKPIRSPVNEENFSFFGSDFKIADDGLYYAWSGYHEIYLARVLNGEKDIEIIEVSLDQDENDELPLFVLKVFPSLAFDNNHIHMVWFESRIKENMINPPFDLYAAKVENQQNRFSESKMIANLDYTVPLVWKPSIGVTADGMLLIVCNHLNGSFVISSKDEGDTFSDAFDITFGRDVVAQSQAMVVDQNDVFHFLYTLKGNGRLNYTKSDDLCKSFVESVEVGTFSAVSDIHLDEKDEKILAVWEDPQKSGVYFSKSGENPPVDTSDPGSSGGGGGSGCFIRCMFN